jgi:phosphate transport system substrate-binding protein
MRNVEVSRKEGAELIRFLRRRNPILAVGVVGALLLNSAVMAVSPAMAATTLIIRATPIIAPIATATQPTFQQAYPDTVLSIGTNQAKKALLNGQSDIGLSHTALTSCQVDPVNGDDCGTTYSVSQVMDVEFGRDAIAIVVNTSQTGVTQITTAQIKAIYEGSITNWSQLGGPNQTLVPRAINTGGSALYGPLQEAVGFDSTLEANTVSATGLPRLASSTDMVNVIAANSNQIGYCQLGYVSGVKALAVNGVTPNAQTVTNSSYPMYLTMHVLTLKDGVAPNLNPRRLDYVNFMLGDWAQQQATANHFISTINTNGTPVWDVNVDHVANILDIISVGNYWGQRTSVGGWVRQDINHDGVINILDIITVGNFWAQHW